MKFNFYEGDVLFVNDWEAPKSPPRLVTLLLVKKTIVVFRFEEENYHHSKEEFLTLNPRLPN